MVNKWNVLLAALDGLYGYKDGGDSSFRPVKRYFNQETGEMVTILEYKTKRQGEAVIKGGGRFESKKKRGLLQSVLGSKQKVK